VAKATIGSAESERPMKTRRFKPGGCSISSIWMMGWTAGCVAVSGAAGSGWCGS